MDIATILRDFAFSQYESSCYLTLLAHHPSNGSRLSRLSGIARSRIYDVLRGLIKKGIVFEIEQGQYVPLPFDELKKRLRSQFETNLSILEEKLQDISAESEYEYLITLKGYDTVLNKALDMVRSAKEELYLRLFPNTYARMEKRLKKAARRGVGIRLVCMGDIALSYDYQVVHPDAESLFRKIGGESIDVIADRTEALVGIFEIGRIDLSPVIWSRNRWFVTANRDSLRHDFYHYFLNQIYERKKQLSDREKAIYEFIKQDE